MRLYLMFCQHVTHRRGPEAQRLLMRHNIARMRHPLSVVVQIEVEGAGAGGDVLVSMELVLQLLANFRYFPISGAARTKNR